MLGTLLDRLGGLFSKYFLIGSFFPVLLALAANGFLAYVAYAPVREVVKNVEQLQTGPQGVVLFGILIVVATVAYLFSAAGAVLREVLEGQHWPRSLRLSLERSERTRLRRMEESLLTTRRARRALKQSAQSWAQGLLDARKEGRGKGHPPQDELEKARRLLNDLRSQSEASEELSKDGLAPFVSTVTRLLSKYDADASDELEQLAAGASALMDAAEIAWDLEYLRCLTERRADFGYGRVAPTRLGNIAETVQSYAVDCYHLNADAFWGSLERVMVKDAEFYGLLQDARTELSFFVSLWCLTVPAAVIWVVLTAADLSCLGFACVAIAGPALAVSWYLLALRSYRNLATRLRSAIDLYRFDLLAALHVPLPEGLHTERDTWDRLNRLATFGEDVSLSYQHKPS
jgi:hypothetical protein